MPEFTRYKSSDTDAFTITTSTVTVTATALEAQPRVTVDVRDDQVTREYVFSVFESIKRKIHSF